MMTKHRISALLAMVLTLGSGIAQALDEITVTTMRFYDAGGFYNAAGDNDTVVGSVNSDATGSFNSGTTDFMFTPWTADQVMWDKAPGTDKTWSGTSASGAYSYTYSLLENQVAIGVYFTWGVAVDIAVLQIFDCGATAGSACIGIHDSGLDNLGTDAHDDDGGVIDGDIDGPIDHSGVPGSYMTNGPFAGQHATFSGTAATIIDANPAAIADTTSTVVDTLKNIAVLLNDSDFEDSSGVVPLPTTTIVNAPVTSDQGFTLTVQPDGTIDYQPTGGYEGLDSFPYTVTDTFGNTSAAATVSITVSAAPNNAPVETNPTLSTDEDTSLVIPIADVATDGDSNPMTFVSFDANTTQAGTVTVNVANNELTYTPAVNFSGPTDTFTYQVTDSIDSSAVGTVTVTVNAVNDDPVCTNVDLFTDSNTELTITEATDLIVTCSDVEGDTLSVASTTTPVHGDSTLASDGAGILTYTPATDYTGADSFDYTVSDGQGGVSVPATANITVGVLYGNFTMLSVSGEVFGGTNDVVFVWDGVTLNVDENDINFGIMTIESNGPQPFFGAPWAAHHVRVFGEGTYTFDTTCTVAQIEAGQSVCDNLPLPDGQVDQFMTLTVGPGQFGAHILFDWNGNVNIDVVNLWDVDGVWEDPDGNASAQNDLFTGPAGVSPDITTSWALVSRDVNSDGVNGSPMIDGPFIGYYANFSDDPGGAGAALADITTTVTDTQLGGGVLNWRVLLLMLPMIALLRRRIK